VVLDSLDKTPLEFATVSISNLKDSSLVSYTLATKDGSFLLRNLPAEQPLKLLVSFVGYQAYHSHLNLAKGEEVDLKSIHLSRRSLNEVVITSSRAPVVVKKDTIEFNTEAFKTRPNAVVEELLKKLPGVQVDNDGTITVNGKGVSKLTIDGKEFFANDLKIATKNLNADLIDKVQIYDDREDDPDHLVDASKVNKIINLKLKKAIKRSVFGKVYSGGGTRNRFESGGLINMFKDTLQVSLIGIGNNLNKTGFSDNDLSSMGGFNRSGRESLYDGSVSTGGNRGGMERIASGGVNINTDYGKKLKMNLLYFYSNSENTYSSSNYQQRFLGDTTLINSNNSVYKAFKSKHAIKGSIQWKPNTEIQIRYTPQLNLTFGNNNGSSFTQSSNNFVSKLSDSEGNNTGKSSDQQFRHGFSYYRSFKKKGMSLNVYHNLEVNSSDADRFNFFKLASFISNLNSTDQNRFSNNDNSSKSGNVKVNFRYPFTKKLTADWSIDESYRNNADLAETFNFNALTETYDSLLVDQSSDLERSVWSHNFRSGLTYDVTKKLKLKAGLATEWLDITNKFNRNIANLHQRYFNLLPFAEVELGRFTLSYDSDIVQPSISDLQPVTYVYSPLYSFSGNPLLKPSRTHNGSMRFYTYKAETQRSINFYVDGEIQENNVVRKRTMSSNGAETSTPLNMNGRFSTYSGGSISRRFKKIAGWQFRVSTDVNGSLRRDYFQLNKDEGGQDGYSFGIRPAFAITWKDKVELKPAYRFRNSITAYRGIDYKNVNTTKHQIESRFTLVWPKKVTWEGNYEYSYNSQVAKGYRKSNNLLSGTVAIQMLKKNRGEIKLSVYDVFDQNISVYRYAYENSISTNQNEILKRYFMLTYQYKFNKTITK